MTATEAASISAQLASESADLQNITVSYYVSAIISILMLIFALMVFIVFAKKTFDELRWKYSYKRFRIKKGIRDFFLRFQAEYLEEDGKLHPSAILFFLIIVIFFPIFIIVWLVYNLFCKPVANLLSDK